MSGDLVFRFSLGPVQGCIAQARRTRDLWAGSFLLSWLAAKAIVEVRRQQFVIDFPNVDLDPLILAIENGAGQPILATVPNQFKASGCGKFDPKAVENAVRDAWRALADKVYQRFISRTTTLQTERAWQTQIDNFWEINWVCGKPDGTVGAWLAARKNWRSHRQPDQGGEHCTLMGEWQEISGFSRGGQQRNFWNALAQGGNLERIELREGERLCAIAMVKRLFPLLNQEDLVATVGWVPGGDLQIVRSWPSMGHVAAAKWLAEIAKRPSIVPAAERFASDVRTELSARHFSEQHPKIRSVREVANRFGNDQPAFPALDANFLRVDDLVNANWLPLYDKNGNLLEEEAGRKRRDKLVALQHDMVAAAKASTAEVGEGPATELDEPPPYYALLLMDGDRVGELLDGKQDERVSRALSAFTQTVQQIFDPYSAESIDGLVIYAGGDHLLALVTVEDAIPGARRLARAYRQALEEQEVKTKTGGTPDISAALVFADHHEPFRDMAAEGHRLLDEVAKKRYGRASLAISVQKPSGKAAEWVGKWRLANGDEPPELLTKLARSMALEPGFSDCFIYNLRARYIAPAGEQFSKIGFTDDDLLRIFKHELGKSRDTAAQERRAVDDPVPAMLAVSRRPGANTAAAGLDENGLLVVRFLQQYGIWR